MSKSKLKVDCSELYTEIREKQEEIDRLCKMIDRYAIIIISP